MVLSNPFHGSNLPICVTIGILGRVLFTKAGQDPVAILENGCENVLPMIVETYLPPVVIGLYIAVILSAIMSTIDSLLVVASSAVVRDFYQKTFKPETESQSLTGLSRLVTVILAVVALGLAIAVAYFTPERTIFWFVIFGWSGIAATFCPVIILSLFYKNFTEKGAIAAMVTGFLSVPFFKFIAPEIALVGPYFSQIAELLPSFVCAMIVGIIISVANPMRP